MDEPPKTTQIVDILIPIQKYIEVKFMKKSSGIEKIHNPLTSRCINNSKILWVCPTNTKTRRIMVNPSGQRSVQAIAI
ncbi:MAG: hypothetical protein CMO10_01600 [Thalassospira sp.]|nr:hypothetical protein [Thalassospira sp.]